MAVAEVTACADCGLERPACADWPQHWSARFLDGDVRHYCPKCSAKRDQYEPAGRFIAVPAWRNGGREEPMVVDTEDVVAARGWRNGDEVLDENILLSDVASARALKSYDLACHAGCDGHVTRFFVEDGGAIRCSMCGKGLVEAPVR